MTKSFLPAENRKEEDDLPKVSTTTESDQIRHVELEDDSCICVIAFYEYAFYEHERAYDRAILHQHRSVREE